MVYRKLHVVIIGAGIAGLSAAEKLSARGHEVTVVEALSGPALATSRMNAGQLLWNFGTPLRFSDAVNGLRHELSIRETLNSLIGNGLAALTWGGALAPQFHQREADAKWLCTGCDGEGIDAWLPTGARQIRCRFRLSP
jgi:glycine/D-amino acid oxidase-like deaminating enzyme